MKVSMKWEDVIQEIFFSEVKFKKQLPNNNVIVQAFMKSVRQS